MTPAVAACAAVQIEELAQHTSEIRLHECRLLRV